MAHNLPPGCALQDISPKEKLEDYYVYVKYTCVVRATGHLEAELLVEDKMPEDCYFVHVEAVRA